MKNTISALEKISNAALNRDSILSLIEFNLTTIPDEIRQLADHLKELHLDRNQLNDISTIVHLKNLEVLFLGDNRIVDCSPLSTLKKLRKLNLYKNQISDISFVSHLKKLTELFLHYNQCVNLSPLRGLEKLTELTLGSNQITDISPLAELTKLRRLTLPENPITDISYLKKLINLTNIQFDETQIADISVLANFVNLKSAYLSNNRIVDVTPLINLKNLSFVDLQNNLIENIPSAFFESIKLSFHFEKSTVKSHSVNLYGNPLQSPTPETLLAGTQAILDYFDRIKREGKDRLFEAKLLVVGEGGSGKTTFRLKMENEEAPMPGDQESTKGIDIYPLRFKSSKGEDMQLNIWDFGGQEIYHQTHQFFLTQRSLYVLLTDNRKQDTDFNWWLDTIQAFGNNSPVLIVQNEKGDRSVDINMKELTETYPQVQQALSVNFANNRGVKDMRKLVETYAAQLEQMGEELPKSWVAIRKQLEKITEGNDYISVDQYLNICKQEGITNHGEALRLCGIYHNLGVLLHFASNAVLKNTIILRNEWATDAVYKVLDDKPIINAKGRFTFYDCERIWAEKKYTLKHHELLEMMLKFHLCYRMHDTEQYLLPQLLPAEQPEYKWQELDNLQVVYFYEEYMPKGLVNQLMARLNWYADISRSWKTGTVLTKQEASAEIRQPLNKKEIIVRISGHNKRDLLLFIDEELARIHRGYAKIKVIRLVGCICTVCINDANKQMHDYDVLIKRMLAGKSTVECNKSMQDVPLVKVINRVFPIRIENRVKEFEEAKEKPVRQKFFISYSKADKIFRDRLVSYLQQFERNGVINSWSDKELTAGENWDEKIKDELENSDVILFLCSQDMLNTDYIQRVEIKRAFERQKEGKVKVIPIILKPCTWTRDPYLPQFSALPSKGIPVIDQSWGDVDYAYMNIFEEIEKFLQKT